MSTSTRRTLAPRKTRTRGALDGAAYIGKKPSGTKTVHTCGECGAQCSTKESADAHCICSRCRKQIVAKPEHSGWRRHEECERCRFVGFIRTARAEVRRHQESVASAEHHLEELLGEMVFIEQGMTQEQAQRAYKKKKAS